jgi:NADPH:quinone reductase-like Zn-dependent oxidoreductase/aryl carrier-like protein
MMTLANLWAAGNEINLEKFGNPNNTHYPKYVWNHKTYTNTPLQSYNRRHGINPKSNLIEFSVKKHAYITDHIIDSKFIFPTVGYFDIILRYFCNQNSLTLDDFQIKNMYIPENDYVQFKWDKKGNNLIFKSLDDKIEYINTQITTCKSEEEIVDQLDLNPEKYHYQMTGEECYNYFLKVKNFNFKDNMKSIENVLVRGDQCLIKLMNRDNNDFIVEPTFLDAGLLSAVIMSGITNNFTYLPIRCDQVKFYHLDKKPVWINSRIVENNLKKISIDVDFYDENFVKVASYTNYQASNVSNYDSDNNFRLEYKNLELINNNSSNMVHLYESDNFNLNLDVINDLETNISNLIYSNCENKSINQLKDDIILMDNNQNLKNIYFIINNNHNGLHQGFLRSYVNESTKNISIIQLSNNPKNDKKYIFDIAQENYEYNSEYYLQDENVKTIQVKPHQNSNFVCDKYYFNKNGKGLDSLRYFPLIDNVIEDYDVIVDVKASALNFKDLMVTLDVVPEDYIGYEAAGIVVKSNTKKYNVGDEVAIIKNKSGKAISNYVHCKNDEIFLKPKNLSFAEATTIGIVFSTVYICLIERARIQKGDTVLIHSATGGVGQSAIQICKMMGAEIIASAGNDDKRNKLKNQYGVKYVTNSRDPQDFKRDVLKFTDGKGVDVILNSLSGDSLRANFEIVKKGGIIVEIGKRDSIENNFINLQKFLDSITYSSVHFDRLSLSHPEYIEGIIKKVVSLFEEGALKPIEIEEFHISEAEKAIKHMAKGIHTGKIVLNVDDWKPKNLEPPQIVFNNKLYYLISGGLGGLGIELINWMNSHGANNFILTSRSGRTDTHAERIINILKNKGCDIVIAKVDTTDYDQLKYYFENNDYQIDGVFHLAGAIKDKYIKNLEESDINDVVDPKVKGCNNIYKVLEDQNLSYFVTFSSISALIGNPGQSAYCAANCYLDRFCHKLRSEGKHGLSINVGAIGGTGMIHRDYNLAKTMISNNFSFIHYQVLFNNLLEVLLDPNTSQICITNQDWNKMSGNYPKVSLLSDFKDEEKGENVEIDSNVKDQIIDYIKELLEIDNIDPNVNLTSYGIDSIMSMGLSNWFKDTLSFNISQLQILQGITINQILEKSCNLSITNNDGESGSKNKIKTFTRKSINLKTDEINNFLIELDDEEIVEKTSESNNSIFNLNIWTILFFSIFILFPIFFLISKA